MTITTTLRNRTLGQTQEISSMMQCMIYIYVSVSINYYVMYIYMSCIFINVARQMQAVCIEWQTLLIDEICLNHLHMLSNKSLSFRHAA